MAKLLHFYKSIIERQVSYFNVLLFAVKLNYRKLEILTRIIFDENS